MSEGRESNPLIERVDALLKRHQDAAPNPEGEVPVLTEVVDAAAGAAAPLPAGTDALAAQIERAVLERLAPEIQELVRRAVREAVVRAVAAAAKPDKPGP